MVIGNKMIRRRSPFLHHMPEAVLTLHLCGLYTGSQRSTGRAGRCGDERSGGGTPPQWNIYPEGGYTTSVESLSIGRGVHHLSGIFILRGGGYTT